MPRVLRLARANFACGRLHRVLERVRREVVQADAENAEAEHEERHGDHRELDGGRAAIHPLPSAAGHRERG